MEYRRGGQRDVILQCRSPMCSAVDVVPPEIAMGQHRALGAAGRAGRVHDHCDIVVAVSRLPAEGSVRRLTQLSSFLRG